MNSELLMLSAILFFISGLLLRMINLGKISSNLQAVGWCFFGFYWFITRQFSTTSSLWIVILAQFMGVISFYIAYKVWNKNEAGLEKLTYGFLIMALIYGSFVFFEALNLILLEYTTYNVSFALDFIGIPHELSGNLIVLKHQVFTAEIIEACTGISAIAFIVGLIHMSEETFRKKLLGSLIAAILVYVISIFRLILAIVVQENMLFEWWPYKGIANSFQFFEEVITPIYVLIATLVVVTYILKFFPDIEDYFYELAKQMISDLKDLIQKIISYI